MLLGLFLVSIPGSADAQEARLVIQTSPKGASIKVDGRLLNKRSPVAVSVNPGTHRVSAGINGYRVATSHINIQPGVNYIHLSLSKSTSSQTRNVIRGPEPQRSTAKYKPAAKNSSGGKHSKAARRKNTTPAEPPAKRSAPAEPDDSGSRAIAKLSPSQFLSVSKDDSSDTADEFFPVPQKIISMNWPESPEERMFKRTLDLPKLPDRLNVLLLGLDRRDRRGKLARGREIPPEKLERIRARSDTIMVAQFDLVERKVRVVSIPRDTRVYLSRRGSYGKINEAYFMGKVSYTRKVVEKFLDIPIHRHAVLDYRSMKTLITIYHSLGFDFRGYDDTELFWYLRKRSFRRGDLRRIERQQDFIRATAVDGLAFAGRMSRQQGLIGWAERTMFDTALDQALDFVDTDIAADEVRFLIHIFRNYDMNQATFTTVPGRVKGVPYGDEEEDNYISYFFPRRNHSFEDIIEKAERKRVSRRD